VNPYLSLLPFFSCLIPTMSLAAMQGQQPSPPLPPISGQLHDIKDVIALPVPFPWLYWLGGILVVLIVIGLVFFLIKKTGKRPPVPPAHEKALLALKATHSLITSEQSRKFAIQMTEILRRYIEKRFHLFRPALTNREFLHNLTRKTDGIDPLLLQHNELLSEWLSHCDMVKFARYTLRRTEMEQMSTQVRDFIIATRDEGVGQ